MRTVTSRGGDPRAQRVDAPHLEARADDVPEPDVARLLRARRAGRIDAELGRSDADGLASREIGLSDTHALDERAVLRVEVADAHGPRDELERDVATRHLSVGEAQIARWTLADEDALGLCTIEHDTRPRVRSAHDDDGERVRGRLRRCEPGLNERR